MCAGDASGRCRDRDDLPQRSGAPLCRAVGAGGRGAAAAAVGGPRRGAGRCAVRSDHVKMGAPRCSRSLDRLRAAGGPGRARHRLPARRLPEAMDVSCWSFLDLTRRAATLMTGGGTIFAMSYHGANEVIENYGIMGPVKAALESAVRYLAVELGPKGIRVHAISPGPLATRAASGIPDFDALMARVAERAPARRLVTIEEVGAACVFLASPYAGAMTGDTIYIDGGYHVLG